MATPQNPCLQPPTTVRAESDESCDRIIREDECKSLTSLSRTRRWELEKEGRFPIRRRLGPKSVGWLLSQIKLWQRDPFSFKAAEVSNASDA